MDAGAPDAASGSGGWVEVVGVRLWDGRARDSRLAGEGGGRVVTVGCSTRAGCAIGYVRVV